MTAEHQSRRVSEERSSGSLILSNRLQNVAFTLNVVDSTFLSATPLYTHDQFSAAILTVQHVYLLLDFVTDLFLFYLLCHLSHPVGGAVAEVWAFGAPGPCHSAEEGGDTCSTTE